MLTFLPPNLLGAMGRGKMERFSCRYELILNVTSDD